MVQGELNTALSPAIANQTQANNVGARLYENINPNNMNVITGVSAINDPNSASNGGTEKKKKVGNYIISKTIGEGSFAKVRLGYHLITQQMVAVKVINKREVLKRNYLRANLRREASMMQRMQHPHIIQLYEVMETENCYYIVMELIDGIEFVKYLTKKRSLDENETRQYIRQICSAVDHMHKAKVVHRDIKLQNFMLDQNHNLTIIDFGLSNSLDERDFLNTQCGSPAYAAPEIFAHQDYGPEVDIWSIGVNMYAMLAGKLPFKVENRSKNLAKLHACILKGFEMPTYLSPDCQDLLCRLLDPSPNKRLKLSEIFAHPWLNYNSFPVEIIPYKPVVDLKEIKPQIVQYLVQKHDYTENEVIDAIVHRKPIAIKAVYYLIEKRLKQGLSFPDAEYQSSIENENAVYTSNIGNGKHLASANSHHHQQHHGSNGNILLDNANINNLGSFQPAPVTGGLVKQNSQLLPKRHGIQLVTRSSSQKNVDFKSIFNNMNMSNNSSSANGATRISFNNLNRETTNINNHNNNDSAESPSPDFIAAAMSPIKTNQQQMSNGNHSNLHHVNSASSTRNAKSTNYQDIIQRKSNGNANSNGNHYQQSQQHNMPNGGVTNKYMSNERYYVPMSSNGYHPNRMSPSSEDSYAPVSSVHYHSPENIRTATTSSNYVSINPGVNNRSVSGVIANGGGNGGGPGLTGIRSLPSSIYRGSPERSLPRSPERMPIDHNNNYRPTTSRVSSSRPSANGSELSGAATYDGLNGQKYKTNNNYMGTKRSLTSCEDPNYDASKSKNSVNIIKNRQLQMGKAKIDLDTPQNFNVGVSIKNLGSYLKSSITRNSADALKTFNSLNIKPSSNYGKTSAHVNGSNEHVNVGSSKSRQSTTLTHRHSNPGSSYSTSSNHANGANMKTRTTLQQNPPNTISTDPSALPRIRINS